MDLNGDNVEESLDDFRFDPEKIAAYKFAPITSVDVERSFSTYKRILDDRRHNLLDIHIETIIIVNFTNFQINKVFKFFGTKLHIFY